MARFTQLLGAISAFLLVIAPSPATTACGLFVGAESSPGIMDAQRALIVFRENTIDLHVQVVATDTAGGMSWLIPVPAVPDVSVGDAAIFDVLDALTSPSIHADPGASHFGGTGCEPDEKSGGGFGGDDGAQQVTPIRSGQVGSYTYDIVEATDVEELVTWLTEAGYTLNADVSQALEAYVTEGWTFVSARLTETADPSEALQLAPLVLTIPRPISSQIVYPLGLSRFSSAEVMPSVFYVLADKRYRVTNFGSTNLQGLANRFGQSAEELTYDDTVDLLTAESGGRLMVTEFARDLSRLSALPSELDALIDGSAFYLTRLYSRSKPISLVDATFIFAKDAPEVLPIAHAKPMAEHANLAYVLLLMVLALMVFRRFTPSYREQ